MSDDSAISRGSVPSPNLLLQQQPTWQRLTPQHPLPLHRHRQQQQQQQLQLFSSSIAGANATASRDIKDGVLVDASARTEHPRQQHQHRLSEHPGERLRDAVFREASEAAASEAARKRPTGSRSRAAPSVYFLPRRSPLVVAATYGAITVAGVLAGMAIEMWIRKKVEEDGGYLMGGPSASKTGTRS